MVAVSSKNKILPPLDNPRNANDYVFIDDVINSFYLCVNCEISSGIINIGSGHSISVFDIFRYAENIVLESDVLTQKLEKVIKKSNSNGSIPEKVIKWN